MSALEPLERSSLENVVAAETKVDEESGSIRVVSLVEDMLNSIGSQLADVMPAQESTTSNAAGADRGGIKTESVLKAYTMTVVFAVAERFDVDGP